MHNVLHLTSWVLHHIPVLCTPIVALWDCQYLFFSLYDFLFCFCMCIWMFYSSEIMWKLFQYDKGSPTNQNMLLVFCSLNSTLVCITSAITNKVYIDISQWNLASNPLESFHFFHYCTKHWVIMILTPLLSFWEGYRSFEIGRTLYKCVS